MATRLTPSSLARLIATARPRLLNEPVGSWDSSFTHRSFSPSAAPSRSHLSSWCHALAERRDLGLVLDGQEFLVAPHGRRPTGDRLGGRVRADGFEVVAHPERPTLVKSLKLVVGQVGAIDGSLEVGYVAHQLSPYAEVVRGLGRNGS